jgi:hypothetical protein
MLALVVIHVFEMKARIGAALKGRGDLSSRDKGVMIPYALLFSTSASASSSFYDSGLFLHRGILEYI